MCDEEPESVIHDDNLIEDYPHDPYLHIQDVLDSTLAEEERERYIDFANYLEEWIITNGDGTFTDLLLRKYKFYELYKGFLCHEGSLVNISQKETSELHAYWVIFFRVMRKRIPIPFQDRFNFKYSTIDDFTNEYSCAFKYADNLEMNKLYFTANWMAILFSTVDARGNKGLAMTVVPKVIEGYQIKYSTGGGQSAQTKARVKIYEHEGNVRPHERPTRRATITLPLHSRQTSKGCIDDLINTLSAELPSGIKRSITVTTDVSSLPYEEYDPIDYGSSPEMSQSIEDDHLRLKMKRATIGFGYSTSFNQL